MPNIDEYTSEEGCESSQADAAHDFHSFFKKDDIIKYVNYNIPEYDQLNCELLSEDKFIDKYDLKTGVGSTASHKEDRNFLIENLNENINQRYKAHYIIRPQRSYRTIQKSLIQEYLRESGILTDVFFVCDVAYANVREDLKFAQKDLSQTFYWVQNAQTLYDPAGKTTWHSDKPYFEDEVEPSNDGEPTSSARSSPSSPGSPGSNETRVSAPNHFKMNGSKFVFCWQNAKTDIVTFYPEWSKTLFPNKDSSYKFTTNRPEQMLYTNKNLFLSIRAENVNDYASQEAYLIITDPLKPRYYGYADKILSAKGTGILKPAEIASYRAKGTELKKFVKFIKDNSNWTNKDAASSISRPELFLDELMIYSPYFQILAKKVGDASQSLSCCQKEMNLQKFKDNTLGPKIENNIEDFKSNGNHAFVSFDRLAIGCALNYNCPIVLGDTLDGIYVYIRVDLLNVHKQFDNLLQKNNVGDASSPFKLLNILKKEPNFDSFILDQPFYTDIEQQCRLVKENITKACLNLNLIPTNDITYQNFLINHFIELNVLQLFSNLNLEILNFNADNFNNKIKKIYIDKLVIIISLCGSLLTPITDFCDLTDIIDINNINDLINTISINIGKLIDKIKNNYDNFKIGDDTSTYSVENTKHNEYTKILQVLREIEKIILDISEIQKLLLSNLSAINKLNQYQSEINSINEQPTRNDEIKINLNINNVPKGVATNILNCIPYASYLTNSRSVRSSDIFFERSTSIFGTTTMILQIFNTLKCQQLDKLNKRFVKIIYNLLNELTTKASSFNNVSFISVINAAKAQFNDLLIEEPSEPVSEINYSNIHQFITLEPPSLPHLPPLVNPLQTSCSSPEITPAPSEDETLAAQIISEPEISINDNENPSIKEILKNKNLIITVPATSFTPFRRRIDEIRNLNKKYFNQLFDFVASKRRVDSSAIDPKIKTAYENEIFIKGFIGLFAFLKYTEISTNKQVPAIFTTRSTGNQNNILERLFGLLYLNLDDKKKDVNLLEEAGKIRQDITRKIPSINFDTYRQFQNHDERIKYITELIERTGANVRTKGSGFNAIVANLDKYVDYSIKIEEALGLYQEIDRVDAVPPIDKSDFSVDSFKKLLHMNVITVDSKPLTGNFEGINANQINANVALFYFIENRIASLNKDPLPHPELVGLFSQLFKETGLNPQEYITDSTLQINGLVGGGDGLFDVMYDLFVSNDDTDFKLYRRNSFLLLNMPNNYEIAINNFQTYPYEILMFLKELKREYDQEQSSDKYISNLGNLAKGAPPALPSNFYENNFNNQQILPQIPLVPTLAGGSKYKKYKTKKNKLKKNKTKRLKSKRFKTRRTLPKKKITKKKHH
jgi:hypothetical protein